MTPPDRADAIGIHPIVEAALRAVIPQRDGRFTLDRQRLCELRLLLERSPRDSSLSAALSWLSELCLFLRDRNPHAALLLTRLVLHADAAQQRARCDRTFRRFMGESRSDPGRAGASDDDERRSWTALRRILRA